MTDGKNCPVCGEDVGFWPVATSVFWLRCSHCRTRLRYVLTGTVQLANVFGGLSLVGASLIVGVLAGIEVLERGGGLLAVMGGGLGVVIALAIPLGFVLQMLLAPTLRRTQTLVAWEKTEQEPETW